MTTNRNQMNIGNTGQKKASSFAVLSTYMSTILVDRLRCAVSI